MAQMNISNTLHNDTSEGVIAFAEQLKQQLINWNEYPHVIGELGQDRPNLQNDLNALFLSVYEKFLTFLNDADATSSAINTWKEIERFLADYADTGTLKDIVDQLNANIESRLSVVLENNTGSSTTNGMSQKAITDALGIKQDVIQDLSNIRSGVAKVGYYECSTQGSSAAKAISADNYVLSTGGSMKVKMTNKNTAASGVTLNINSTGAKALYYDGELVTETNTWDTNEVVEIYYDGTSYYANSVGSGDGAFDISAKTRQNYETLNDALTAANSVIPTSKKKGGMSIKFKKFTPVNYTVKKTTGLTVEPFGTLLNEAPSVNSGTYTASQLSVFPTLPSSTGSSNAVTYYTGMSDGVTTIWTKWVITKGTTSYVQYRLMSTAFNTTPSNWQGVDEYPIQNSNNLVKSGSVYDAFSHQVFIEQDSQVPAPASFDPEADTVHLDAQVLSEAQKTQARANLGFGNGDIDSEPVAGSRNLVESGGVADKLVCLTFVNVNYLLGTANFFTFPTAIQSVPLDKRAYGCIVTWRESNFVWKTVQYLVASTSDTDWFNSRNWKSIVVDTAFVVRGGIDKNGEPYNYADYMSSNYFKAENGIVITGSQGSKSAMVCFYDEAFNFISYANVPTGEQSIILGTAGYEIPNGAVYFRASGSRAYNNGYISFTGFPTCDATFVQDWKNSVRQNFSQFMTLDIGYSIGSLNVGDIVTPSTQYNINSVKVKCKQGDIFEIYGRGGGGPRLYGWCDNEMKLISMSDSSLLYSGRITAPSDGYLIFNNLVNIVTNPYIARVNIEKTEINKYFIKLDGSGDFTNLVTALKTLASDETYKEIYLEGGTHNILQQMGGQTFIDSIPSNVPSSDWPLYSNFVPNNTRIVGLGNATLDFQVPDDTPSAKMAVICPLAFRKNVIIENLTITAKNCRYCIHDETGDDTTSYIKTFRNVKLYKTGGGYSASYGAGFSKNSNYLFDGCVFSSVVSPVWSMHDNVAADDFTNITIKNSIFIAASGIETQQALYFGTVNATSGVKNVMIENCNLGTGKIYLADSASKPNRYQITVLKSGTPNFVVVSGENPYTPSVFD